MVNSKVSSKGWHNESLRHSQAKRFGKAGGISKTSNKKRLRKKSTYSLLKEPYKELHNSPTKDEYGRDAETPEQRKKAIEASKRLNEEIEESKGVNNKKNVSEYNKWVAELKDKGKSVPNTPIFFKRGLGQVDYYPKRKIKYVVYPAHNSQIYPDGAMYDIRLGNPKFGESSVPFKRVSATELFNLLKNNKKINYK